MPEEEGVSVVRDGEESYGMEGGPGEGDAGGFWGGDGNDCVEWVFFWRAK